MKILITTVFFPPQNAIASQRPYVWAREWAKAGHDVTVLTVQKDLEKGDLSERPFTGFRVVESAPGAVIEFLRRRRSGGADLKAATNSPGQKSNFRPWIRSRGWLSSVRLPDVFDFWISSAKRDLATEFRNEEFDLVVSTFGPHASLRAGYFAINQWPKAKWIIDFRDLWTANHVYPGLWPFTVIERYLEKYYLSRADAITTVSPALAHELKEMLQRYNFHKPIEVFTNGFDPKEMSIGVPAEEKGDSIVLLYTGSLHPVQRNPEPLLQAISLVPKEVRHRFKIIFAGPREEFLTRRIYELDIGESVSQAGSLKREMSLQLQAQAAVLLFFETQHEKSRDGVLTGKLFEYLATGRPIWAIGIDDSSTVGTLIEAGRAGKAFGSDVEELKLALLRLAHDGPAASRDISSAQDVLHQYDRSQIAQNMLTQFQTWITTGFGQTK